MKPQTIAILVVVVLLLFGAPKLPGLARNLGKSMRIFKTEVDELRGDEELEEEDDEPQSRRKAEKPREETAEATSREFDPQEQRDRETVSSPENDERRD